MCGCGWVFVYSMPPHNVQTAQSAHIDNVDVRVSVLTGDESQSIQTRGVAYMRS